jgi:hypothetical protein
MSVPLINPVEPQLIQSELTGDRYVTSLKGIDLYVVTAHDAPNTMNEIGRIREREFRMVGAGRNVATDIDEFDTAVDGCRQLVAWDPAGREIVAMYRFALCRDILARHGARGLRTAGLFDFDPAFVENYLRRSIELARSVVNKAARRAVMGLFAVWQGLGALTNEYPEVAYFFGNATVYRSMSPRGRDLVVAFLRTHYGAPAGLVRAKPHLAYTPATPASEIAQILHGDDAAADQRRLVEALAEHGEAVPPILLSYLGVTRDLMVFDVAVDPDFADAYEIALAIPIGSVNQKTRKRFVDGYTRASGGYFDR